MASERPLDALAYQSVPLNRYVVFVAIVLLGCAADLATKHLCFASQSLRAGETWWLWRGHAGIQLSLNEGALFGLGWGRVWVFGTLGMLAAIAIPIWLFVFRAARDAWLTVAVACVMAGVLGNLHDRLGLHGLTWPAPRAGEAVYAVRDWILWQVNDHWRWPNFNIADSMLVVGACFLFLHALWQHPASRVDAD
jgi:signal peptidase II